MSAKFLRLTAQLTGCKLDGEGGSCKDAEVPESGRRLSAVASEKLRGTLGACRFKRDWYRSQMVRDRTGWSGIEHEKRQTL